jgi:hypothetical protein
MICNSTIDRDYLIAFMSTNDHTIGPVTLGQIKQS